MGGLEGGFFGSLEGAEGGVDLGREDFGFGGLSKAKFADGEAGFQISWIVSDGRPEGAAEDGARGVEVAGLGCRVEDGAGVGVGPFFEEFLGFGIGVEDAGLEIAGEEWGEVGAGGLDPGFDAGFEVWRCGGEGFAETMGVEGGDLEDAVAALGAAGPAGEVLAGAGDGGGE